MVALFLHIVLFALGCICSEIAALSSLVGVNIDKQGSLSFLGEASTRFTDDVERIGEPDLLGGLSFYVLNLDRRKNDKFMSLQQVIGAKAPWMISRTCRVSAPDGAAWNSNMDASVISGEAWKSAIATTEGHVHVSGGALTKGAVGLMVGHALVWEHIVRKGEPFAVVMEDDLADFHPHAKDFLEKILTNESLQQGWDFLILDPCRDAGRNLVTDCNGNCGHVVDIPPKITVGDHVYCTPMYIIKQETARKALKSAFPITNAVQLDSPDGPLWSSFSGAYTQPSVADASHDITDVQQALVRKQEVDKSLVTIPDCAPLHGESMIMPTLLSPTKAAVEAKVSCSDFMTTTGCGWTQLWNCPQQEPGSRGHAGNDGSVGYQCCCDQQLWKTTLQASASTASNSAYSMVVIVRTHSPMPGMLERMKAWADDLHQSMPSVLFAISIDTTGISQEIVSQVTATVPSSTIIHSYTWQDILAEYPGVATVSKEGCIKKGFKGIIEYDMLSGYGFHTEAIVSAVEFIRARSPQLVWNSGTKVWVLEDDIFLCGSKPTLSNFLRQYASDDQDDLLTARINGKVNPQFVNVNCSSPAFKKRYPLEKTFVSYEFVTRWSNRLLQHIKSLLADGVHSQSEMFGTTVCMNEKAENMNSFHCAGLRPEFVGKDMAWNTRVNRSEAEKLCSGEPGNTTVNHAGKYF